ncbi:LysR family transcriptional regulator [Paraburkholderia sp. SIMBA_030]|uniref:helix-turn-helix domain-containing protein n=1 Tax=Paraburkholderia sp. SIMBA_030 TaxID=3085773 RepID=UPI00397C8BF1
MRDFLTIAAHDSFTEAAKATGTVRPAISRKVADLEKALGFSIVERSPGRSGLRLTRRGKVLHRAILEFDGNLSVVRKLAAKSAGDRTNPLGRAETALHDLQDAIEELKAHDSAHHTPP